MKTPMEIARYTFAKMHSRTAKGCENEILYMIESAIESDRAQRAENTVTIELDEEHEPRETVSEVLNLIGQGYESGIYPRWELNYSLNRGYDND